jgi:hypothetical protein
VILQPSKKSRYTCAKKFQIHNQITIVFVGAAPSGRPAIPQFSSPVFYQYVVDICP